MYAAFLIRTLIGLALCAGLAFIPANLARNKGYSYGLWWLFGFLLFLVALIVILVLPDKNEQNSAAAAAPREGAEQLKIYKDLLDQGVLNQQEFNRKKSEIINGSSGSSTLPSNSWRCPNCGRTISNMWNTCTCGYQKSKPTPPSSQTNLWTCPSCGRINAGYVGTCACGQKRPR